MGGVYTSENCAKKEGRAMCGLLLGLTTEWARMVAPGIRQSRHCLAE